VPVFDDLKSFATVSRGLGSPLPAAPPRARDTRLRTVSLVVDLTLAAWALLELGVRVGESFRGKGRRQRDRGTRILVALALGAAVGTAAATRSSQPLRALAFPQAAGVVVLWLGLALRVWAIAALGGNFRTTVEVEPDQTVVAAGPYRWVRHPSYTGLLLIAVGFGVVRGAWVSLALCVVLLLPALLRRIHVEEAELDHVLGEAYRAYQSTTKARLIPWLW
jgi:protein-S-isoprenylcysteine O-methyltransferase Ste14